MGLLVTVIGNWIPGSPLEPYFQLSRGGTIWAICIYGFIASVLPVWLLLCPRDYLSSFLKIGTVALLVGAVIVANPKLEAPPINAVYAGGGGPTFDGPIFPFCFICIMCGAISGFHALVSSGTTPKMISRESHIRTIGYGAMLMESFVGVMAMIAACALQPGVYFAINSPAGIVGKTADAAAATIRGWGYALDPQTMSALAQRVGEHTLLDRTGGAPSLAVGMAQIFSGTIGGERLLSIWYHFAIMFEALFILTVLDAGTRVGRFMVQELGGHVWKPLGKSSSTAGILATSALMVGAYGWAFVDPLRKLWYNLTITAASVLVALLIGGIEALGLLADRLRLEGGIWRIITGLNDDLTIFGVAVIGGSGCGTTCTGLSVAAATASRVKVLGTQISCR